MIWHVRSYVHVTLNVEQAELGVAVDALAQMLSLRHLLLEESPEDEDEMVKAALVGETVAACMRRTPLLRRCGHRADVRRCSADFLMYNRNFLDSHYAALHQHSLAIEQHPRPVQLEELIFYNYVEQWSTGVCDDVLRMPNLRTLVLRFGKWRPALTLLLQHVTDLSLLFADRKGALQVLDVVGHQLVKLFLFRVSFNCLKFTKPYGRRPSGRPLQIEIIILDHNMYLRQNAWKILRIIFCW
jgi:hypothetical protein